MTYQEEFLLFLGMLGWEWVSGPGPFEPDYSLPGECKCRGRVGGEEGGEEEAVN